MDFLSLAKARYSCRGFTEMPVAQEKLQRIIEAGIAAPTAVNKQPYKLWVMTSEEAKKNLATVTKYTFGANTFILVGAQTDAAWVRPSDGRNFADVDAAIVATHIMLAVQAEGLGTTWVGHFDAPRLKTLYPEMEKYDLVALFPIGYPAMGAAPMHETRREASETVTTL